jgi:hypothetical protein
MAWDEVTVVVTWLDGTQETYSCYDLKVRESVLYLSQREHGGTPARAIPLASMRFWTEERA